MEGELVKEEELKYQERIEIAKQVEELQKKLNGRTNILFKDDIYVPIPHVATINAKSLDDLYFKAVLTTLEHGRLNPVEEGSHKGSYRVELDDVTLIAKNQRDPITKKLSPDSRPGVPAPTDEEKISNYFNNYIISHKLEKNEHYRYSSWIVGIPEFQKDKDGKKIKIPLREKGIPRGTRLNQLEWIVDHFIEKGYGNNHAAITVGCAEGLKRYDWPYKEETEKGSTECLRQLTFKIHEDQLNLTCFFRSWDLYGGTPVNLGGLSLLMEYTTNLINSRKKDNMPEVKTGNLQAHSDGLHIYSHHLEPIKLKILG